jgi:hypothetical protein
MEEKKTPSEIPGERELSDGRIDDLLEADNDVDELREETSWKAEVIAESKKGADRLFELGQQYLIAGETRKAIYFFNISMMDGDYRSEFYYGLLTLGSKGKTFYDRLDMMVHAASESMDPACLVTLRNILEIRMLADLGKMHRHQFERFCNSCDCTMDGLSNALNDYLFERNLRQKRKQLQKLTVIIINVIERGLIYKQH